ncbi:Hypothetical predicted protein [Octopus vulgaris]|uniref:Arb2 domain-containing protein n=1 Tax=Octopus vulgaris TaxID=6645 RepID=A0AA36BIC3_OCTVU|nr:Hypothetical predicted protein [Octopus vulgaris]
MFLDIKTILLFLSLLKLLSSTKQNLSWRHSENKCLMQPENGLEHSSKEDIKMSILDKTSERNSGDDVSSADCEMEEKERNSQKLMPESTKGSKTEGDLKLTSSNQCNLSHKQKYKKKICGGKQMKLFPSKESGKILLKDPNVISTPQNHNKSKMKRKSLESFKYRFNEKGRLRHIKTGKPFEFNISNNRRDNEKNYEELGEAVTEHIYNMLQKEMKLEKVYVPINRIGLEPQSFIFQSKDALTNPHKLLLLVHGSGAVRAGQWARRLIINDCLDSGSQMPFIKRAVQSGFAVLVLNTNLNRSKEIGNKIRGNGSALEHLLYVWDNFVVAAKAKHIAFVCHSYGGVATAKLANKRRDFLSRISAVAFTDSMPDNYINDADIKEFFKKKSRNWVTSKEPIDTVVNSFNGTVPKVSAGHTKHEMTSWTSFHSIFKYLNEKIPDPSSKTESKAEL